MCHYQFRIKGGTTMGNGMKKAGGFCVNCAVAGFVALAAISAAVIIWVKFI